ncbi:MAG TPA: EutN/CcmL family microcompartment protein [Candidatus Limiplasma sp.]|nr:EutN/CcmL family microcompartment protein [Candidatus Limiplasma sp.]HPS81248.1 EutN/CcmL family microcompartment protein [Candidatus Limiplasma sp.]
MLVGRVTGNVVSTNKVSTLTGAKLLIVQPVELDTLKMKDDYVICVDDVGAGEGDLVFCAYGSSARQTDTSKKFATDYSIYGILDSIDMRGARTYDKAKENNACNWRE